MQLKFIQVSQSTKVINLRLCRLLTYAILIFICVQNSQTFAAPSRSLDMGLSYISYQLSRTSGSDDGTKSTMGSTFLDLKIQYHWPLIDNYLLAPELLYMPDSLYSNKSPDKATKTSITLLGLPVEYRLSDAVSLNSGFGILQYTLKGSGGSVELNNGNSTSTFNLPSRTVSTSTVVWQLGAGYNYRNYRTGADLLFQDLLSSGKRSYSLVLNFGYNILPLFGGGGGGGSSGPTN